MSPRAPGFVAGVDSSTQNCKLVVFDGSTGEIVRSSVVPHPEGTELDPRHWWDALGATGATTLRGVSAMSITAQQHTTLFLDEAGNSVRDALLWNDTRASDAAHALRREWGNGKWLERIGFLPCGAHPIAKLRWLRDYDPAAAEAIEHAMIPHEWLTWRLLSCPEEATTDRSDASATGYWSAPHGMYVPGLIEHALGRALKVPRVLGPEERAGTTAGGLVLGAGCGDNAATALGLAAVPGEVIISVGTSLTVSTPWPHPVADSLGRVELMADARGAFLPIVVSLNGARTLISVARLLGVSLEEFDAMAASAEPDAHGLTFLPYLDGDRSPAMAEASGSFLGLTRASMHPENMARAAVMGVACAAVTALDDLARVGVRINALVLVGGGSLSNALHQAIADLSGRSVERPPQREYAARGAAMQAMWSLTGELPVWDRAGGKTAYPKTPAPWMTEALQNYERLTRRLFGSPTPAE